jgi:uncharacterized BrkB/YihY/UPF0761 family membrane protein
MEFVRNALLGIMVMIVLLVALLIASLLSSINYVREMESVITARVDLKE